MSLSAVCEAFGVDWRAPSPIEVPNWGRDKLAGLLATMGLTRVAEIGVKVGDYSEVLAKAGLEVLCVDPWLAYDEYFISPTQAELDKHYELTKQRLAPYPNARIVRQTSMEAVKDVPLGSLDAVYIDGNHELSYAVADLMHWSKRVRAGGVIAGHDYTRYIRQNDIHALQAVHAFTDAYRIQPWFVLGRKQRIEGEIRDNVRSFCWVKK